MSAANVSAPGAPIPGAAAPGAPAAPPPGAAAGPAPAPGGPAPAPGVAAGAGAPAAPAPGAAPPAVAPPVFYHGDPRHYVAALVPGHTTYATRPSLPATPAYDPRLPGHVATSRQGPPKPETLGSSITRYLHNRNDWEYVREHLGVVGMTAAQKAAFRQVGGVPRDYLFCPSQVSFRLKAQYPGSSNQSI